MLTLIHAPATRSTRIIGLLHAMNAMDKVDIRLVQTRRADGAGFRDPANPHPDGKVPFMLDDGQPVWESAAIMLHLTDCFPDSGMGVPHGHADRGRFLSWMVWYGSVLEPVMFLRMADVDHPMLKSNWRGRDEALARIDAALSQGPWLMGDRMTAADLLIVSPFQWMRDPLDGFPAVQDWVARAGNQPWHPAVAAYEQVAMATLAARQADAA
jgi:glutathione S-transferase